jgi:hypothetical protein
MKLNCRNRQHSIHPDRYRCLRRLLREEDCQYLREAGFAKLAREKRASDRRAFLRIVRHLSLDIRRVADARQQQLERAGIVDVENILQQRVRVEVQIQKLTIGCISALRANSLRDPDG